MPKYKCMICRKEVKDSDKFEWSIDGDKTHSECEKNRDAHYSRINNMSDKEFHDYMMGKVD